MLTSRIIILVIFSVLVLFSCERFEVRDGTITGKVQKGPFAPGTEVTLYDLASDLGQTGRSFIASVHTNEGYFELKNIDLKSGISSLKAEGFYFSELYGEYSTTGLTLQALADLSDKEAVNINILTHLTKPRIEKLVQDGQSFRSAKKQAESELLSFLGINQSIDQNFEDLDISVNQDNDGILLAISIIVQRYTFVSSEKPSITPEIIQLLANLGNDFRQDGQINDESLINNILNNISKANLIDIRENIEKCYSDMGISLIIPDFENYIAAFQSEHSDYIYTEFVYPDSATTDLIWYPDVRYPNILSLKDSVYFPFTSYPIAAIVPLYSNLTIKFISPDSNSYNIGKVQGWKITNSTSDGFELKSQRNNVLITMEFGFADSGSATVEYFEDEDISPTYVKNIYW